MELDVRRTFVDLEHDSTIASDRLTNFQYVSKGGFALVFEASFRRNDGGMQPVAVKVLKPENHFRPDNYSKFLQEVAFQTALQHPFIVRSLGFCSVPVRQLIDAAPPGLLIPSITTVGKSAASLWEWFAQRRLEKCWAIVMELMPDGNLFDQVLAATRGPASRKASGAQLGCTGKPTERPARPSGGTSGNANGLGSYSDAQALLWLIDVSDAMTFLHSCQPLLIHRDLKLENILLRKEADGLLRARLSDFGLTVGVDAAGCKVPPPQILRAPGQSLQDVCASVPGARAASPDSPPPQPPKPGNAAAGAAGLAAGAITNREKQASPSPGANRIPNPWGLQQWQWQWQLRAGRKVQSSSQLAETQGLPAAASQPWPSPLKPLGRAQVIPVEGRGQVGVGPPGCRPWSAAQAHLQQPVKLDEREQQWGARGAEEAHQCPKKVAEPGAGATIAKAEQLNLNLGNLRTLRRQRLSVSWTGTPCRASDGGRGDVTGDCRGGLPTRVGPHGLHPVASQGALLQLSQPVMGPYANLRSSCSRRSETGHLQVKMDQLNGLLRLGMGHKDYLPDMYQMTFKLTSQCGSVCYMAPEIARQLPYNQKADIFSFGCIIFEVMTRQLLSDGIADGDVEAAMEYLGRVSWSGWRPDLPTSLPKELRLLISLCWHREPRLRPSFPTIGTRLRELLLSLAAVPGSELRTNIVAAMSLGKPQSLPHLQHHTHQQQLQLQLQLKILQLQQQHQKQQQQSKERQQKAQHQQQQLTRLHQQLQHLQLMPHGPEQQTSSPHPVVVNMCNNATFNAPNGLSNLQTAAVPGGSRVNYMVVHPPGSPGGTGGQMGASAAAAARITSGVHSCLEANRQQQLQLHLQQLNAYTRTAGSNNTVAASGGIGSASSGPTPFAAPVCPPSPYTVNSVGSRLPSLVESSCTTTTYTVTTGCRISSSVLGGPGGRGGLPSLETSVAPLQPGRATAGAIPTFTVPQNCDGGYYSLPSPVSPKGSRGGTRRWSAGAGPGLGLGSGAETVSRGNLSRSDGSGGMTSGGSSFKTPRSQLLQQQQQLELGKQKQEDKNCMWSCNVM